MARQDQECRCYRIALGLSARGGLKTLITPDIGGVRGSGESCKTMVNIEIVTTSSARKEFVCLAERLYAATSAWVAPLRFDLRRQLDPKRGEYFLNGNSGELFLARRNGEVVGRIAAFRNESHLRYHQDDVGFFGFFECINDQEVAAALLDAAASWLRKTGLVTMRGPANFNVQEEAGVLLDGFDLQPMVGMNYTLPYYAKLLEATGCTKAKDLFVFRVAKEDAQMDQVNRIASLAARKEGLVVRPINLKKLPEECAKFATIFAEAWRDNWGMVPISAKEFQEAYERYRFFIVPELTLLAEIDGEPAGCALVMPDMNVSLKRMKGRLFSPGLWHLLTGRSQIDRYRFFMAGVRPEYRRLGLPVVFLARFQEELIRRRAETLEFSWVLETNHEVIALMGRIGAKRVQTLRLFERAIG